MYSSGALNNQVVLDDNLNKNQDDDEMYGHTQLLSKPEVSLPTVSNKLEPVPNSSASNSLPTKKAKFGLPGISPMPVKSKDNINLISNTDTTRENYRNAQSKPKFGIPSLTSSSQNYNSAPKTLAENRPKISVRHNSTDSSRSKTYSNISPENSHPNMQSQKECTTLPNAPIFHTAHEKWVIDNQKRFGRNNRADVNQQAVIGQRWGPANSKGDSSNAISVNCILYNGGCKTFLNLGDKQTDMPENSYRQLLICLAPWEFYVKN